MKHSKIILDERSANILIKRILGQGSPVKNIRVTHENDHLHLKAGINYDNVPGEIDIPVIGKVYPLQKLLGNHIEGDLRLSVGCHHLKGNLDFHGIGAVIQQAMGVLGIDSVIFFFAPKLKSIGAFRIHGLYNFDFDLSSLKISDGKGGEMQLTDLVKFHSISVGERWDEMLKIDFSVIK